MEPTYTYGCPCEECRAAQRAELAEHAGRHHSVTVLLPPVNRHLNETAAPGQE